MVVTARRMPVPEPIAPENRQTKGDEVSTIGQTGALVSIIGQTGALVSVGK